MAGGLLKSYRERGPGRSCFGPCVQQRRGPWRWSVPDRRAQPERELHLPRQTSLADADQKFGTDDHCRFNGYPNFVLADWPAFGLIAQYSTYGGFRDPNGNGCNKKDLVALDQLIATGRYWHTDRGLRVGDRESRLLSLYPDAVAVRGGFGLHQRHLPLDTGM
jgi:hypothetical protein